jgi:hypothetical protein
VGRPILARGSLMRSGLTRVSEPKIGEHAQRHCCLSKKLDVELIGSLLLVDTACFSHVPVACAYEFSLCRRRKFVA